MTSFDDLNLAPRTRAAIDDLGYEEPTPVQEQAIPLVLEGRDVIAAAKTGTGKTASFSLPILSQLGHARHGQGPLALVVTPTRELAQQIESVCRTVAKHTKHRVVCLVGGVSYEPQKEKLARGCDVVISTPGRLIDLMNQGSAHLGQVEVLVLDEADRMLDMGFLPDVRRIVKACPTERQTLLFSATIDASIEKNMAKLLKDPAYVEIAHKGETADLVEQYQIPVEHTLKQHLLHALLEEKGGSRIIVFARTRHRVDSCVRKLRRAGYKVLPIHSDRSQNQRSRAIAEFAADKADILVATDVLARGIDIPSVNYVVNFDLPTQAEDYVHRIGRTGRAGENGLAISFVTPDNKAELKAIEKLIKRPIPEMEISSFDPEKAREKAERGVRRPNETDPEITEAIREERARKKRKEAAKEKHAEGASSNGRSAKARKDHNSDGPRDQQPRKTRGTATKSGKRSQQQAGKAKPARKKMRSGKGASGASFDGDFRPGRSQRRIRSRNA